MSGYMSLSHYSRCLVLGMLLGFVGLVGWDAAEKAKLAGIADDA
jgi:hypothetical protein